MLFLFFFSKTIGTMSLKELFIVEKVEERLKMEKAKDYQNEEETSSLLGNYIPLTLNLLGNIFIVVAFLE